MSKNQPVRVQNITVTELETGRWRASYTDSLGNEILIFKRANRKTAEEYVEYMNSNGAIHGTETRATWKPFTGKKIPMIYNDSRPDND